MIYHAMLKPKFHRTKPFLQLGFSANTSFISSSSKIQTLSFPHEYILQPPNPISLSSSLQHYINSDNPSHGQKIHTHILKTGFVPNTNIYIKMLILHLKSDCLKSARQVFDEMPQRTLSAYNYMISGCVKQGSVGKALGLFQRLIRDGERPDGFTLSMLLKVSGSRCSSSVVYMPRRFGRVVHGSILRLGIDADDVLYTALVDSYVKNGEVGYARIVFDMMLEENVVCSTAMITGYMARGDVQDAEEIYRKTVEKDIVVFNAMIEGYSKLDEYAERAFEIYIEMQRMGFQPNISTFASIIGACSIVASYEVGQQIQCQLMKTDLFQDVKLGSALIDMYAKCGKVEDARRIFNCMPNKNVFSWTSMIDGYGKNGEAYQALELFNVMQKQRVEPNDVTFLGALSACAHAGLVDRGLQIFESMERDYGLNPTMEQYACMVDILGRAGSLRQAWEFVMKMPVKPNSDVWAALLSSCRLYGEVEMARVAANELFKINEDGRPGAYVALSNALADSGNWDHVNEIRELMKSRGISKVIARSWIGADR